MSMNRQQRKAAEKKAKKEKVGKKNTSSVRAADVPIIKLSREETLLVNQCVEKARQFIERQDYLPASELLMQVIKKKPDHLEALGQLSIVAEKMQNFEGALNLFLAIKKVYPGIIEMNLCIAHIYMQMGDLDKYFETVKPYLDYFKDNGDYLHFTGLAHLYQGQRDTALKYLRKACQKKPTNIDFIYNYIVQAGKRISADDPFDTGLVRFLEENADSHESLYWRTYAHYTLYNIYEKNGDIDKAFEHLKTGSRLKMEMIGYPREYAINRLKTVPQYFSKEFFTEFNKSAETGPNDTTPVFIIGMPRSGTTLLEQILHSHPDVVGIGEDLTFEKLCMNNIVLPDRDSTPYPLSKHKNQQNKMTFAEVGKLYLEHIKSKEPNSKHIVNKSIGTYMFAGLIPFCLPGAKVIHIRRNAMDSCLSTFTKSFTGDGHKYSYDLECLGEYYHYSMLVIDHWLENLPSPILRVDYEHLVENTESEAHRIIDFLGLEWDDRCLEFHKTEKTVRTASINQVRKPVYKTSVERWRKYEKHLIPLIQGLGESAPKSAKEYLKSTEDN